MRRHPNCFPSVRANRLPRSFATSGTYNSRIGKSAVAIPPHVTISLIEPPKPRGKIKVEPERTVEVQGPLGKVTMSILPFIHIEQDLQKREASVSIDNADEKFQLAMWGTTRAYLQNHVLGVSEGHTAILRLVGVGYRATIEKTAITVEPEYEGQEFVSLKVGYSHPIELGVPKEVKASTPQPTRILLESPEKEIVMQFAAKIRKWRVPEPYKGKGIFVNNETIKLKAKKIK